MSRSLPKGRFIRNAVCGLVILLGAFAPAEAQAAHVRGCDATARHGGEINDFMGDIRRSGAKRSPWLLVKRGRRRLGLFELRWAHRLSGCKMQMRFRIRYNSPQTSRPKHGWIKIKAKVIALTDDRICFRKWRASGLEINGYRHRKEKRIRRRMNRSMPGTLCLDRSGRRVG
ncbi:MAG: hypothetical protein ACOC91_00065 [bacterium]